MKSFLFTLATIAPLMLAGGESVSVDAIQKRDRPFLIEHESGAQIKAIFVDASGEWAYLPDDHFIRTDTKTYMAAPVGRYLVTDGSATIVSIIEEGSPGPRPRPNPGPSPEPEPGPEPSPQPDDQKLRAKWVVFIEEIEQRNQFQMESNTMRDADLAELLDDLNISLRIYDDDQPQALRYIESAQKRNVALPCMFIIQDDQNYKVVEAPASVAEAESLIRGAIIR